MKKKIINLALLLTLPVASFASFSGDVIVNNAFGEQLECSVYAWGTCTVPANTPNFHMSASTYYNQCVQYQHDLNTYSCPFGFMPMPGSTLKGGITVFYHAANNTFEFEGVYYTGSFTAMVNPENTIKLLGIYSTSRK